MFRKLLKNKKAQQTVELALLISLVVAAIIAMQTFAQRAIQSRIRDAAHYMANRTTEIGNTLQYEPYYASSSYDVDRDSTETQTHNANTVGYTQDETRTRKSGGFSNTSTAGITNGI